MKLPNGYGGITKLSGIRRTPYRVRITTGWEINEEGERIKQNFYSWLLSLQESSHDCPS